jgi:hypothetical protein
VTAPDRARIRAANQADLVAQPEMHVRQRYEQVRRFSVEGDDVMLEVRDVLAVLALENRVGKRRSAIDFGNNDDVGEFAHVGPVRRCRARP